MHEGHSIWIAQKAGAPGDGDDKTDPAILKMFCGRQEAEDRFRRPYTQPQLIVPVSISYELDPTDKRQGASFTRSRSTAATRRASSGHRD